MSSVTIKELYWELKFGPSEEWTGAKDIEVVPRKMVEMIIEKCNKDADDPELEEFDAHNEAYYIAHFAKELLKQFEEE